MSSPKQCKLIYPIGGRNKGCAIFGSILLKIRGQYARASVPNSEKIGYLGFLLCIYLRYPCFSECTRRISAWIVHLQADLFRLYLSGIDTPPVNRKATGNRYNHLLFLGSAKGFSPPSSIGSAYSLFGIATIARQFQSGYAVSGDFRAC